MRKYEDEAMELIETVAESSHHNPVKPFRRGAMPKGQMIVAKSAETRMLLERIDKMVEVQNLLLDRLNIHNCSERTRLVSPQEASPCAYCSRFDHIKLDCLVMAIQGQGMFRQGPSGGQKKLNRDDQIFWVHTQIIIIPLFSIRILCSMQDLGGTMIKPIIHLTTVSHNINNPTPIKDSRRLSRKRNRKPTRKPHTRTHRH